MSARSLRIWLAVVVSALAWLAGGPSFAAPGISSIAPAEARPDDIVTINGNGFGGPNVKVTVGGVQAKVVTATGNKVTFTVPRGLYPGPTTVTAANPGGNGGAIGFRVLLGFSVDSAATVSAPIGSKGGTLRTRSGGLTYELNIPPTALVADTFVTLTPVTSIANLPFSRGVPAAAQFGPSGLRLQRPGTLTVTRDAGAFPASLVGFLVDERGALLEVRGQAANGLSLTVPVEHFTVGGSGAPTPQDFENQVRPILNSLPTSLPTGPVGTLVDIVEAWMRDPVLAGVCLQTTLCADIFDIGIQSLALNKARVCADMTTYIQHGQAELAYQASKELLRIAFAVENITNDADLLGLTGFDTPLDIKCLLDAMPSLIDLTKQQAETSPDPALLTLLDTLAVTGAILDDVTLQNYASNALVHAINELLKQATQTCLTDYAAGEALINDVILGAFSINLLDQFLPGLSTTVRDAYAGCRIQISPLLPSVLFGGQVQFSAVTQGLAPRVYWEVVNPALGSSIDLNTGLFTAGAVSGAVKVRATNIADAGRYAQTIVTIRAPVTIAVTPPSATVLVGGTVTFHATINGGSGGATWTASGGSIPSGPSLTATYAAGSTPGTYSVTAKSVDDPSKSQTMQVVVTAPGTLRGKIKFESLYVATPVTYYGWTFGALESVKLAADVVLEVKPDGSVVVQSATGSYSHGFQADQACNDGSGDITVLDPVLGPITLGWNQEGLNQGADSGSVTGATFNVNANTGMLELLGSTSGVSMATQGDCSVVSSPISFPNTRLLARPGVITRQNGRIVKIDFTNSYADTEYTETITGVLQ